MTVTVKLHPAVWPCPSLAVQRTAVTPIGNTDPGGGTQETVGVVPHAEVAVGTE